jgi:hypothetical protein
VEGDLLVSDIFSSQATKGQSFRMAEGLSCMWDSLSFRDDEDGEMEIQQQA